MKKKIKNKRKKEIFVFAIIILVLFGISLISSIDDIYPFDKYLDAATKLYSEFAYTGISLTHIIALNIVGLILNTLMVVGAVGLLNYKEWGRKMVLSSTILLLLLFIGALIFLIIAGISFKSILNLYKIVIGPILYILILVYFTRKEVRKVLS